MQAIVLAGGLGTRIRSLYTDRPKALIPVAGKPFLQWQLEWLQGQGVRAAHIAAGHLAEVLQEWIDAQSSLDMAITLSTEPEPLGTAGGLKWCEPYMQSDPFIVLNGDSLIPHARIDVLSATSERHGGAATLAVTRVSLSGRYGTVQCDEGGCVTAFLEKQDREEGVVNAGIYLLSRSILDGVASGTASSLEHDLFPALVARRNLFAVPMPPPPPGYGNPRRALRNGSIPA